MKMYRVQKSFETIGMMTRFNKEVEKFVKCKTDSFNRKMDMIYRNVDFIHNPMQMTSAHSQISYVLDRIRDAKYESFVRDIDFREFPMSLDLLNKIILSINPKERCYESIVLRMCEQNRRSIVNNFKWLYAVILMGRKAHTGIPINIDPKNALINENTRFIVFNDDDDCFELTVSYSEFIGEIFENGSKVNVQSV